jgi:uncharacterized protein (TIGR02246 family)
MRALRFALALALAGAIVGVSTPPTRAQDKITEDEAFQIATEAYIYGYPLVTMEMTRRVMTNVAEPTGPHAPMGQFANLRTYPNASFRDVTAPNADTLYSAAWLDLAKEPYILSLPDEDGRYYLMPMLSGWTDVFEVPGSRTTGTKAQKYALTGPSWKGNEALPDGVTELKSPTSMVWIIGRTYCTGAPEDYKAVHALQDRYSLVPLSAYGTDYKPPKGKVDPDIDMKTAVRDQVNRLDAATYFKMLAALMKDNPPAKDDAPMVARLAKIGIVPGKDFDLGKLDPAVQKGLERAPKAALEKIAAHFKSAGTDVNGWRFMLQVGQYGTDYLQRAFVTWFGLGANRPRDAVYPTSEADAAGKKYSGAGRYTLTFPRGQMPPVKGFWSLTMYDAQFFFVANPLNRYTLSQRNKLKENADGSVTLYIQNEPPGQDRESNWLPAPKGDFVLMLRLYWPKEEGPSIFDGTWKPPAVKRVGDAVAAGKGGKATLQVRLPADARLTIDGAPTPLTGPVRTFISDEMKPGSAYDYELRATWSEGGRQRSAGKKITVRPGDNIVVDLTTPDGQGGPEEHVALKPVVERAPTPDEEAILKNAEGFIAAFHKGDAKGLAAFWVDNGDYTDITGRLLKGRGAIEEAFVGLFAENKGLKLRIDSHSLRFLTPDVAVEEGVTSVIAPDGGPPSRAHYAITHVKKDGQWKLGSVRDTPYKAPSNYEHLKALEWALGEWADENQGGAVARASFAWAENQNFIVSSFASTFKNIAVGGATQWIGWDPAAKQIRSWTFDSSGGFGEGVWTIDGDKLTIKTTATLRDGKKMTSTSVVTRIDADTLTWRSVERAVDGKPLPDQKEVRMKRVK